MFGFVLVPVADAQSNLPANVLSAGWTVPASSEYRAAIDSTRAHAGKCSLLLESIGNAPADFSAMQRIKAGAYQGKRIRLSGWLDPSGAPQGAALWLRVDMPNGDYILDNMLELKPSNDPSKHTSQWVKLDLVAQVPEDAVGISFGARMKGPGRVWADDLSLAVVPLSVATTTIERRRFRGGVDALAARKAMLEEYARAPAHPVNMSFEIR